MTEPFDVVLVLVKAYDTRFVREVGIDSRSGFEIGLELTAKARRLRRRDRRLSKTTTDSKPTSAARMTRVGTDMLTI